MTTQPPITSFFGSKKRKASDALDRNAKLLKGDPTLLKVNKFEINKECSRTTNLEVKSEEIMKMPIEPTTPKKKSCDIRSFLTSKSPYRPDCKSSTPVKFFRCDDKVKVNETTPAKSAGSILKNETSCRQGSTVKKSIRFEDETPTKSEKAEETKILDQDPVDDTDAIIKAANALVEKIKTKSKTLSDVGSAKEKKPEPMTSTQLKKKLARSAKLAELKSSLSKLGKEANELMKIEKKRKEVEEPKITKFEYIEVEVPRSPHKGALASPVKLSPAKPAYERFAHLIRRTGPSSAASSLPLPLGFQTLLDLFVAADTVSSMMLNRGETITFRKLKPAVQELTRKTLTERHMAQIAAILPNAYNFRQEKMRNFGSTSKQDRYELVIEPADIWCLNGSTNPSDADDLVRAADKKKMTPKHLQIRREAFTKALLNHTMDKHEEFLASLDPPLSVNRDQLTRWHPNFPVDLVPSIPPVSLPEPPTVVQPPTSAKEVLERAQKLLSANSRMRDALEAASRASEASKAAELKPEVPAELDPSVKAAVDKRVAAQDPLKGIPKSLLEKIRAKQAAKALEIMKMTPSDEKELLLLSQLPDLARVVRTHFVDYKKGVFPWETVLEKIMISNKRSISKGEAETGLRRLVKELPDWASVLNIKGREYLKLNRTAPLGPIIEKLNTLINDKKR